MIKRFIVWCCLTGLNRIPVRDYKPSKKVQAQLVCKAKEKRLRRNNKHLKEKLKQDERFR